MRVLFFISDLGAGGAERTAANLCNGWCKDGYDVALVTMVPPGNEAYSLENGVKRLSLAPQDPVGASGLLANLSRIRALRFLIREHRAQVVVAFMTRANVLAILAGWGLDCRVVVSERIYGPRFSLPRMWQCLRRLLYRHASAVVAQTPAVARWIREELKAPNVTVIPNGLRWPLAAAQPRVAPESIVCPHSKLVLAVGRLENQKGFDLLIDAFGAISESHADWVLVIVGEGEQRQALESRIPQRVGARVFLVGAVGNMAEWYERAEIFVLSSRFEGFPNVLLEAMAAGCAVVSADCPTGPAEIVRSGEDGVLVPSEDILALSESLAILMDDPAQRNRLGRAATKVLERFDGDEIARRWERLLH